VPKSTPRAIPETNRHNQELHYRRLQTNVNDAMSSILAKLSGLTHDAKMDVMRAVVAYGEAEHSRARMAEHMKATEAQKPTA